VIFVRNRFANKEMPYSVTNISTVIQPERNKLKLYVQELVSKNCYTLHSSDTTCSTRHLLVHQDLR